jgi:transcriptional regulator with GAF, ATPase, and Fis domain/tetratricopeptide (TPR) repeat protein
MNIDGKGSINGRYRVLRVLGEGSQGKVYAAVDTLGGDREVALKTLVSAEQGSRFRFEFEQAKKLEHPHLAAVYELGVVTEVEGIDDLSAGAAFYTQELVGGVSAREWARSLRSEERPFQIAKLGVAVARALALLHGRGLLHRDVKPSNILVGDGGRIIKLIDLGLASLKSAADGLRAGTLGYMAEEALHGFPDERSDLYSLAVTMAELLTDRHPRPLAPVQPEVPEGVNEKLWSFIKRMTHARKEARLQSARETVLALARAVGAGVLGDDRTHELIDATSEADTGVTRVARVRSTDLVGREQASEEVSAWIETALATGSEAAFEAAVLVGPPGVGKTRLLRAAMVEAQLLAAREGRVPPSLLAGELRALLRAITRHVAAAPGRLLERWLNADGASLVPARLEKRTEALVEEMVEAIWALSHPTVILIEDGERALARALMARLDRQPRGKDGVPVAVVAEVRDPGVAEALTREASPTIINLSPLTTAAEARIVENAIGRRPDRGFLERLHRLTGGIPLLTESVLAALLSLSEDGPVERVDFDAISLKGAPDALVLKGFLQGLTDFAVSVAEAMAAIDDAATVEEIAAVAGTSDTGAVFDVLREIASRGFVHDAEGLFTLMRLVSMGLDRALPPVRAKALHRRALEMLARRDAVEPERLARHAVRAGMKAKARAKAREAADALAAAGDLSGAKEQLLLWLDIGTTDLNEMDAVQTALARICRQTGEYDRAVALALAVEGRGLALAPQAALERAAALRLAGNLSDAVSLLDTLTESENEEVALEARAIAARIALDSGRIEEARQRLSPIRFEPEEKLVTSGILSTGGLIALASGDPRGALGIFETGLNASARSHDLRNQARFHGLLGMVYHRDGEFQTALEHYRTALTSADKTGDRHGAATFAVNLAAALTELGRIGEALNAYRDGLGLLRLVGRPIERAQAGANYAQLLLRVGDSEAAESASRAAVVDAERSGEGRVLSLALCVSGDVKLSAGKLESARAALEKAERLARKSQSAQELTTCRQHLADLALIQGHGERAREWLDLAEASGCERPNALAVEQSRLRFEVAVIEDVQPDTAFDQLIGRLPMGEKSPGENYLKAFASAARGARRLGRRRDAQAAASAALDILRRLDEKTPSLHRPSESPLSREMTVIRDATADTPPSAPGVDRGWEHLARINTRLNSEFRVGRLLEMVMDAAIDITGAERGFLLIVDKHQSLKVSCARNMDKEALLPDDENYSRTVAKRAFDLTEPILTTDATEDARFKEMLSVVNLNLRYIAAVPLKVDGRATGTIYLDSRRGGYFDESRLALLEALADQAAIALTNARLKQENRHRQQRIERLNRALQEQLKTKEQDLARVKGELEKRTHDLITKYRYDEIIARSKPMTEVFRLMDKVVPNSFPVIIRGESGTGKELVARAIHYNGPRRKRAFVAENCGAIPETLLESVLFGHVRGAFTGAVADNPGLFAEAHQGTLFLDEISEMPLTMQTKLLRVLQEGEVRPLGGTTTAKVDVRILVASNVSLKEKVKRREFREDLFYRLNVIGIEVPPLRQRREDIPLLAEHFVQKHAKEARRRISREAIEALMDFPWPGNVRQLENEIIRAVVLCDNVIEPIHLSDDIISGVSQLSDATLDLEMGHQVDRLKKRLIAIALKRTGGNQTAAAALLGLSRYGLQKMMSRFDMKRQP